MKVRVIALCVSTLLLLLTGATFAHAQPSQPGTARYSWTVRWPSKGRERVFVRTFRDRGGFLRRVEVSIGGRVVPSAPHIRIVGCVKQPPYATAQATWLWDGHNVVIVLLLMPGKCQVGGHLARVRVALTTVGT